MSRQNEALLDSNKELRKFDVLKIDHEAEVKQRANVTKRLEVLQENAKSLAARLEVQYRIRNSKHLIALAIGHTSPCKQLLQWTKLSTLEC